MKTSDIFDAYLGARGWEVTLVERARVVVARQHLRAGCVSMVLLEWLRNAVQPPGSRTHLCDCVAAGEALNHPFHESSCAAERS